MHGSKIQWSENCTVQTFSDSTSSARDDMGTMVQFHWQAAGPIWHTSHYHTSEIGASVGLYYHNASLQYLHL